MAASGIPEEGAMCKGDRVALVVAQAAADRVSILETIEGHGFLVVEAQEAKGAWERFQKELPDLVVLDLRTPGAPLSQLVRQIRRAARSWVPILAVTTHIGPEGFDSAVQIAREGATEIIWLTSGPARLSEAVARLGSLSIGGLRREKRLRDMSAILSLLPECEGNVSKLSRMTEIPRSTLYALLKEMGLLDAANT